MPMLERFDGELTVAEARARAKKDPEYAAVLKTELDSFFRDFSATMDHLEKAAKRWKKAKRSKR